MPLFSRGSWDNPRRGGLAFPLTVSVAILFPVLFCLSGSIVAAPLEEESAEPATSSTVQDSSRESSDSGEEEPESFFKVDLEDLVKVQLVPPAALTKLSFSEVPASVTVITAEDIKHTPARNIYDLIEVYVPGAIWMNYEEGPQLGIRGNIANRNFKYLLRVNGRVMNNKAHYGAQSELELWDLNDIQRIEIVRGPGSVTYGPGAVAGVINIITHTGDTAEGLLAFTRYVTEYDSKTLTLRYGVKKKNYSVLSYGSITGTEGDNARQFTGTNDQMAGYVGEDVLPGSVPLDYFGDYRDNPQVKLHLDVSFLENWRFWTRYTQQGSNWRGNETKTLSPNGFYDQQGVRNRQFTSTLQYDKELHEDLTMTAMLSTDYYDVERSKDNFVDPNPANALNKKIDFSELEVFFRGVLNWQATNSIEIAAGGEYSWDRFASGWGDSTNDILIGPDGDLLSGPGSNGAVGDGTPLFVGDGWDAQTVSFFTEANIELIPRLKLLLSARVDKNTYSDWMFSPRIVVISEVADGHTLKFIAQESQRMGTAGQLYALFLNGNSPENESVTALELIYTAFSDRPLSFSLAAFWNDAEVIAWNQEAQETGLVGDLQLFGLEPEISYTWSRGLVGASYSYVKQLDWQLAPGVPSSGISYSDYLQPLGGGGGVLTGLGNDLNNWPNQSIKVFTRTELSEKVTLHVDARVLWDFQGAKDGLSALASAVSGLPEEAAVLAAIGKVNAADTYEYDFRLNASLDFQFTKGLSGQLFAQNLIGANGNKRYSYDTGNNRASPKRARFTEEARAFGAILRYEF